MADTDILTVTEVQALLGVAGDAELAVLQTYITAASKVIDDRCGPVVIRECADVFDGGGTSVRLSTIPVDAVTLMAERVGDTQTELEEEYGGNPAPTDGFVVYPEFGKVVRRSGGADARFAAGRLNITAGYTAGRYVLTSEVDGRFKEAAFMIVRQLWTREQATGTATYGNDDVWVPTYAVPNAVDEILQGELLAPAVA